MDIRKKALTTVSAMMLSGALIGTSHAQTTQTDAAATQQQPTQAASSDSSYATGTPLSTQSKEGFWGHMNPFARKKWVHRQLDPVKDRVNELDQVQAKNANDIRDVDSRAQAGIRRASDAAALADQHATDAGNRANTANGLATSASTRTDALHGTVSNLDQYETVTAQSMPFVAGRTALTKKQKADLDQMADSLASEKGYIIEVQGYSRAGVAASQNMADSVVRYLVTEHQVPVYRIYKSGLGHTKATVNEGERPLTNGVRISLLHNSLSSLDGQSASNSVHATGTTAETSAPGGN